MGCEPEGLVEKDIRFRSRARLIRLGIFPQFNVGQERNLILSTECVVLVRNFRQGWFAGNFACHPSGTWLVALLPRQSLDWIIDTHQLLHQTDVLCSDFSLQNKKVHDNKYLLTNGKDLSWKIFRMLQLGKTSFILKKNVCLDFHILFQLLIFETRRNNFT